jgi:hypothetical protein
MGFSARTRSAIATATAAPTTTQDPRGQDAKEALRSLKHRISKAIYARLRARRLREGHKHTECQSLRSHRFSRQGARDGQTPGEGEPLAAAGTAVMEFTTPETL